MLLLCMLAVTMMHEVHVLRTGCVRVDDCNMKQTQLLIAILLSNLVCSILETDPIGWTDGSLIRCRCIWCAYAHLSILP